MITVDCRDVESILHELAIYVSDQVAAVPAMKFHKFVLAPIMDDEPVDQRCIGEDPIAHYAWTKGKTIPMEEMRKRWGV